MSIFSAIGKAAAVWAKHGDKIERTLEIWAEDDAAPAKPAEVVDELRKVVGADPMTPGERDRFNREHQIHARKD